MKFYYFFLVLINKFVLNNMYYQNRNIKKKRSLKLLIKDRSIIQLQLYFFLAINKNVFTAGHFYIDKPQRKLINFQIKNLLHFCSVKFLNGIVVNQ